MFHHRLEIPTTGGEQVVLDTYVPEAYLPTPEHSNAKRPAIVVCPGGGYRFCSAREAEPIALRFAAEGFVTCVVWYRVHRYADDMANVADGTACAYKASPEVKYPMPQQDAAAAIAYMRKHADEWHLDPNRIAVMGFSAGGHLAASVAGLWQHAELWQELGLTPEDVRPNGAVLCYPVIVADEDAHRGSFEHLSGGEKNVEKHQPYSVLNWVSDKYPPTFLWHTFADGAVPVQNSIRMAHALADAGVKCEMHIFPDGGHGLSLANASTAASEAQIVPEVQCWVDMAARFLQVAM